MPEDYKVDSVFLDRIRLSALIVDKEGQLAGSYATLLKKLKQNMINKEELADTNEFANCWRLLHELYTFMRHNEIAEHRKRSPEEHELLTHLFQKYETADLRMTYEDLQQAVNTLTKVISQAGYHNTAWQSDDDFDLEEA
jgi:hypothetical protein